MTAYIFKIIPLLGGLALFLFGMDVMGKALERPVTCHLSHMQHMGKAVLGKTQRTQGFICMVNICFMASLFVISS